MSGLFGISVSALQAFQTAIQVTSNNIANANTAGYADETVSLTSAVPTSSGSAPIGGGVNVASITRAFSQLNENQLTSSQSSLGQLTSLQSYTSQIDNIVGTTAGGLSTSLTNYYSAWSTVANDPTSTASRQALLNQAQGVASSLSSTNGQLQALNTGINAGITQDVSQVNSITKSISTLNSQIVTATAEAGGQAPNSLLDQRGELVSNLSQLVGVSTTTDANGELNVFVGSGQPLVLDGTTTQLTTVPNQFNASQLEISTSTNGNNVISGSITSGDLGGLLAARTQAVDPAINQLGQIATALSVSANSQQNSGLNLNGQLGANLFSVAAPAVIPSSRNSSTTTATITAPTSASIGALTANDYNLAYKVTAGVGAYTLTNTTDGTSVTPTAASTSTSAAPAFTVDGLTVTLSGTPTSGDQFLIQPTATAAGSFSVALTSASGLAAAGAVVASASDANAGSATISSGTVVDPTNPNLPATTTITFTSPTTYTSTTGGVVSAPSTYTSGSVIGGKAAPANPANGWQVQITGTPATGDTFTVQNNAGGTGDNRNALANANQTSQAVLTNGTISVNGAVSALVTGIGSQAQQVNTQTTAQTAVNTQALATVQSTSGVNLDQEAANLLQWQQAYQASAQALQIGNSTFTSLLAAINGT